MNLSIEMVGFIGTVYVNVGTVLGLVRGILLAVELNLAAV
jgi:hypothetical protein